MIKVKRGIAEGRLCWKWGVGVEEGVFVRNCENVVDSGPRRCVEVGVTAGRLF